MARDGWRGRRFFLRRDCVDEARRRLGIAEPVEVRLTRYTNQRGTVGRLIGLRDGAWRIALDTYLAADEASRTLYHELGHVLQAKRLGGMDELLALEEEQLRSARLWGRGQRRFFRARAGGNIPLEREAERFADQWHKHLPLAEKRWPGWG